MSENKYAKLIKNTTILFIANFGTQVLSFLLVPLYTYALTTQQYGDVDIITTTSSIAMSIVTLSIFEATLRFSMDENANRKSIFTISVSITLLGTLAIIPFIPLLSVIDSIGNYAFLFWLVLFANSIYLTLSLYCRGNGYVTRFAIAGIFSTLTLALSNILFLLVFKLGVSGYLISMTLGYLVPSLFLIISCRLWKCLGSIDKNQLKEMVRYSIPMIPNSLAWLIISISDKYILKYFWGSSYNGLYVVAQKIPALITVISTIFIQSWQLSAVSEAKSEDRGQFFSNIINSLIPFLFGLTILATAIIKPLFAIWLEQSYFEAWKYATILMIANCFSCFSNFVSVNFIAMKNTSGNMKITLLGGLVNLVLNLIFIPHFGIMAASITTVISFAVTWLVGMYSTREFIHLDINWTKTLLTLGIIIIQYLSLYLSFGLYLQPLFVITAIIIYFKELKLGLLFIKDIIFKHLLKRNAVQK